MMFYAIDNEKFEEAIRQCRTETAAVEKTDADKGEADKGDENVEFEVVEKIIADDGDASEWFHDWGKLGGCEWSALLAEAPRYAEKCDWSKLSGNDWCDLLAEQPQFADKCPFAFEPAQWATLLAAQPQFADRVGAAVWDEMPLKDWMYLLSMQPQLRSYWPRIDLRSGNVRLSFEEVLDLHREFQADLAACKLAEEIKRKLRAEGKIK